MKTHTPTYGYSQQFKATDPEDISLECSAGIRSSVEDVQSYATMLLEPSPDLALIAGLLRNRAMLIEVDLGDKERAEECAFKNAKEAQPATKES